MSRLQAHLAPEQLVGRDAQRPPVHVEGVAGVGALKGLEQLWSCGRETQTDRERERVSDREGDTQTQSFYGLVPRSGLTDSTLSHYPTL